ncbi:MAG: hypothetical protein ACI398_03025 [Clostridium sp.]
MKKYKKYKDFIPYNFYLKSKYNKKKYEKKLMTAALIFNLIIVPINIKNINKLTKKDMKLQAGESYTDKEGFQLETIRSVVNELFNDSFEGVSIENGNGEILVDTLDDIDKLQDNTVIIVKEAHLDEENRYKIGVSVNER